MSAMSSRMKTLKLWQLKHCTFLMGQATSGTKVQMLENVIPRMELKPETPQAKRIVSVDMGIRNLAFCAVDVPPPASTRENVASPRTFKVCTWKRLDVLDSYRSNSGKSQDDVKGEASEDSAAHDQRQVDEVSKMANAFTPASLSKIALSLTQELLDYEPDTILIERQRYRTNGLAAIQEWTVRVNMLESMLWACFESLRRLRPEERHPEVHAVSPARVAAFWIAGQRMSLCPSSAIFAPDSNAEKMLAVMGPSSKQKIDKRQKIDVVRSWVADQSNTVKLAFTEETATTAAAFKGASRNAGKLDDVADCLLQAVAWAKWEENQRIIQSLWNQSIDELRPPNDKDSGG